MWNCKVTCEICHKYCRIEVAIHCGACLLWSVLLSSCLVNQASVIAPSPSHKVCTPPKRARLLEQIAMRFDCCKQVESFTMLQSVSPNSLREICFVVTLYEMRGILSIDLWKISDKIYHLLKTFKFVKMHTCTLAQVLEIELENLAIIYQIR